jgi:hypothetical protein
MFRIAFTFLFFCVLFLPQSSFAESLADLQQERCRQISQLAEKIVATEFEPTTITVKSSTLEDALAKAALAARDYINKYNVSPLWCKCLEAVVFVTEEEKALLKGWDLKVDYAENNRGDVTLALELDSAKLTQLALFNIWPLHSRSFKT